MKKYLMLLAILCCLTSFSQTWQYSVNTDYKIGVRDKLGEGKQQVNIYLKSKDGKTKFERKVTTEEDDWKYLSFPIDFAKKELALAETEVKEFTVSFFLGKEELFSTPFFYCPLKNEINKPIKLLDLPDYIQSRLIGEFVESNMYTNDKGVNFYVSQTINKGSEDQRIAEIVYNISIRGEISEYEIRR